MQQIRDFGLVPSNPTLFGIPPSTTSPEGTARKGALFEDILDSHPMVDYSDNEAQSQVLWHHYLNEFGSKISLNEFLKDYSTNTVIHEVVDSVPHTYHGRQGARQAFRDMFALLPHDITHFELEHVAVNHNHAQVVWKAETPHHYIRGTDAFTFDEDNRIEAQSIVALSCEENKKSSDEE